MLAMKVCSFLFLVDVSNNCNHVSQGANWEDILEHHRDGVVQIMVVKKKFMWKAAYRSPLSEEISGSGWFINNNEFAGEHCP